MANSAILFWDIIFILILSAALLMLIFYWISYLSWLPFIPTDYSILPEISKALDLNSESVLFDLGCGDGRVIAQCYFKNPQAKYIGIEKNYFPFWLARLKLSRLMKKGDIKIQKQNFFETDLSSASHVFIYSLPDVALQLSKKFEKELKPGTKVVSLDFELGRAVQSIIDLNRPYNKLGQKIYIYTF